MSKPASDISIKPAISRYPVPNLDNLPADILERIFSGSRKS